LWESGTRLPRGAVKEILQRRNAGTIAIEPALDLRDSAFDYRAPGVIAPHPHRHGHVVVDGLGNGIRYPIISRMAVLWRPRMRPPLSVTIGAEFLGLGFSAC
jgi:hypothetical protein